MPQANEWTLGGLYLPGGPGGIYTQPDGPGGIVYPRQVQANTDLFTTKPFTELSGTYNGVCGHSFDVIEVKRDYDYEYSVSVALICCPICSCVLRAISPYTDAIGEAMVNTILTP